MLEYILSPITNEAFVKEYWDRKPFYIQRRNPHYYDAILTLAQIDNYLSRNDIRFPSIRIAKNGKNIPTSLVSKFLSIGQYSTDELIDSDKLFTQLNEGATIFLQLMHTGINSLSDFVSQLEKQLKFKVETHLFLTPKNSQGLLAHYDTTSAFIMQIFGTKTWSVYEPTIELPLLNDTFDNTKHRQTHKIFEITLQPGDVIFIPKGFVHEAMTNNDTSLHITTVLCSTTWLDVFTILVDNLKSKRRFREASIVSMNPIDELASLKKTAREISEEHYSQTMLQQSFTTQIIDNKNRIFDYLNLSIIDQSTKLMIRPFISFNILLDEKTATVQFYNKRISFPAFTSDALNYIATNHEFIVKDISSLLDDKSKIVLTRKLIKEGFLKFATYE